MQLSYALPLGIAGLLFSMQMDLHNYFVSNQFGAVSYAIYAIGCFQLPLVGIISESVCSVMIPHISLLQKENRHREIILLTARVMRKLAFIYFPLYAFLIVVGREFIAVLFTSQYLESWPVFAINLTMIPVSILLLDPMLRAYAEQRYFLLKLRIILVTGLFAALWFGTSWLGLTGTIFVVVAAAILERLITAIRVGRIAGVTRRDLWLLGDVGKIALASIATGIVTVIAHYYLSGASPLVVIVVCAAIFSAAYPTFILFVAVLEPDERDAIRRIAQLHRVRWRKRPEPLVEKEG